MIFQRALYALALMTSAAAFVPRPGVQKSPSLQMSTVPDFNGVEVAKTGGRGAVSAAQKAVDQNLSLGAPRGRPSGGHFLTKGGVQVTANVQPLEFSKSLNPGTSESAIEYLIDQLDSHKGVLLTSSYEFPGRYARWSLGFVDPPLEISGKADQCTIKALNRRGRVMLPAIEKAMQALKEQEILSEVKVFKDGAANGEAAPLVQVDVTVVPPPEVGTFSEEERSRQVRDRILHFLFQSIVQMTTKTQLVYNNFYIESLLCSQLCARLWIYLAIKMVMVNSDYMGPLDTT